jgi:hypothetical protein
MFTEKLPTEFVFNGKAYRHHSDFREWCRFDELLHDKDVPEKYIPEIARNLIFPLKSKPPLEEASKYILWFYSCGKPAAGKMPKRTLNNKRAYSFEYDFDSIYAAFKERFNIDLVDIPYLHFWKFKAMFNSLKDCKFTEIVGYRIAETNKNMTEETKKNINDMKKTYALPLYNNEIIRSDITKRYYNS